MIDIMSRAVMAALMVVSTALVATDCGGPPFACNMRVVNGPHVDQGNISATLHVFCDPQPVRHNLEVWLEREVGDGGTQWIIQGDITRSNTLPDAAGFDITAPVPCKPSRVTRRWRVTAKAKGLGPVGTKGEPGRDFTFKLPESESSPAVLPCG